MENCRPFQSALAHAPCSPISPLGGGCSVLRMRGGGLDDSPRRGGRKRRAGEDEPAPEVHRGSPLKKKASKQNSLSSLISSVRSKSQKTWDATKLRLEGVMKHKSAKQAQELIRKRPAALAGGIGVATLSLMFVLSGLSLKDVLLSLIDFTVLTPKAIKAAFTSLLNVASNPKLAAAVMAAMLQRLRDGLSTVGVSTWDGVKSLLSAVLEAKDQVVLAVYGVVMALIAASGRLSGVQVASYLWDTRIKSLVLSNYFRNLRLKLQWWRWCVMQRLRGTSRPNLRPSLVHMVLLGQNLAELVNVPLEAGSSLVQRLFILGAPSASPSPGLFSKLLATVTGPFKQRRRAASLPSLLPVKSMLLPGQRKTKGAGVLSSFQNRQYAASYLGLAVLYVSWIGYSASLGGSLPESVVRTWDVCA